GLLAQPSAPVVGQEITLLARVRNFSPEAVRANLTMDADGARQTQAAEIPAWGETEVAFPLRAAGAGPLPVTIATEADAFPDDDARHTVVSVRESLRLAIDSGGAEPAAELLGRLAAALPWLESTSAESGARAQDYRFIAAWDGKNAGELRLLSAAGTTVIVCPTPGCPPAAVAELTAAPENQLPASFARETRVDGWNALPEENHPSIELFRGGDFGNPFAGTFRERIAMPAPSAGRAIAWYADRVPAILEYPTDGAPVVLWNLPLDPAQTDWPMQGNFLPAIAEILLHLRPRAGNDAMEIPSGSALSWSSANPDLAATIRLDDPDGNPLDLTESHDAGGTTWSWPGPARPGIYRWISSGQTLAATPVNFPEIESDLRTVAEVPAIGRIDSGADTLVRKAALANGIPLWPWLALLALAFLLTESIIHLRSAKSNH
ncbi:MAG TPA: hypothetical protein VLO11_04470, partial [Luteolibacter sp.]|nr:hypothetical protein [Luteolibacter sp.]